MEKPADRVGHGPAAGLEGERGLRLLFPGPPLEVNPVHLGDETALKLQEFARLGVLGLLGGLAVFGEAKRRRLLREGKCVGRGVCDGCGVFGDCGLPLAISLKETDQNVGGGDER